jgi:hypothetical protein
MYKVKQIGRFFRVFYEGGKISEPFRKKNQAMAHARELATEFATRRKELLSLEKPLPESIPEIPSEVTPAIDTSEEVLLPAAPIVLEKLIAPVEKTRARRGTAKSSPKKVKNNARKSKKKPE